MRFENKVALVTGGAGGIGGSTCRLLAAEGARIVIADLVADDGEALANEIRNGGAEAIYVSLDVTDEHAWDSTLEVVRARFGRLDILVNNAGISGAVPDKMDLEYFDKLWAINGRGTFLGMRAARKELAASGKGAIVNMSSVAGIVAHEITHMGYNAAKAGVRLMSKSAAIQFAPDGIRVNSVHPGWMTPMRTSVVSADTRQRDSLLDVVPMRRGGTAEEAAKAIVFLASEDASYITGSELVVDGGMSAL